MNTEIKKLLKGTWTYNLKDNNLHLQQTTTQIILENRNNECFQQILAYLASQGKPDPTLQCNIPNTTTTIPLEKFHRILRANTVLYEPLLRLTQTTNGINCQSQHINIQLENNKPQQPQNTIYIDPFQLYKVTRIFRERERIPTTISFNHEHLSLKMEFPWVVLNMKIVQRKHDEKQIKW